MVKLSYGVITTHLVVRWFYGRPVVALGIVIYSIDFQDICAMVTQKELNMLNNFSPSSLFSGARSPTCAVSPHSETQGLPGMRMRYIVRLDATAPAQC